MPTLSWTDPPALPPTHYIDNRIYTDAEIFELERRRIFGAGWKLLCHDSEIARPGDYTTARLAGVNLIVLRDRDGRVRCFFNVCPHRGAALLRQPAGSLAGDRIQCFYHLWSFDSTGRCTAIPRADGYAACGLAPADVRLRELRCELFCGWVFVSLDDRVEPLADFLGPSAAELAEVFGAAEIEVFHLHRAEFRANWKLFVETNCEGYHELLHVLNRTTGHGQKDYAERRWRTHARGHNTFEQATIGYDRLALGGRDANLFPGMRPNGHIVVDLFPDVMFNVRATVGRIDTLTPLAPGLTLLECRGIGLRSDSDAVRAQRVAQHNQVWGPSGRNLPEDLWAIETQWANIAGGAPRYSVIAREEDNRAMDDSPVRNFYAEWRRRTGRASHDIAAPAAAAERAA